MTLPNIILILTDDLGWRDLACTGSPFYETPNIDRLAREGMTFTDAYAACPVCSPTRASLLTGRYPASVGVTDWIDWGGNIHPARGRLVDVPYLKHLPLVETTIASVRAGDYKLIEFFEDGRLELYNLREDEGEDRNLVAVEPAVTRRLHELLVRWRDDVEAKIPQANPDYGR